MEEDRTDLDAGQGLLLDSAEQFRTHIRVSVREALKSIFEEEIRVLCGSRYHPDEGPCRRVSVPNLSQISFGRLSC
jgi:hypothetical protein